MKIGFNPHKQALDELLGHLDKSDDEELGSAMKPKEGGLEVTKVEASGDPEAIASSIESDGNDDKPKLSDEEIAELIEAIQQKLG
jgi:hypothetical protein